MNPFYKAPVKTGYCQEIKSRTDDTQTLSQLLFVNDLKVYAGTPR
jgi:hypothetical protein